MALEFGNPALWSAIAAGFSAWCAYITLKINRRNQLESVRPELMLTGWKREDSLRFQEETVIIGGIRNIGKGPALHVIVNATPDPKEHPQSILLNTERRELIAPDEEIALDCQLMLLWVLVSGEDGGRIVAGTITILCQDTLGNFHETSYGVHAMQARGVKFFFVGSMLAPDFYGKRQSAIFARPTWFSAKLRQFRRLMADQFSAWL